MPTTVEAIAAQRLYQNSPEVKDDFRQILIENIHAARPNNSVLLQLHTQLSAANFDWLRKCGYFSTWRAYNPETGKSTSTSRTWAVIEKAIAIQITINSYRFWDKENAQSELATLSRDHPWLKQHALVTPFKDSEDALAKLDNAMECNYFLAI